MKRWNPQRIKKNIILKVNTIIVKTLPQSQNDGKLIVWPNISKKRWCLVLVMSLILLYDKSSLRPCHPVINLYSAKVLSPAVVSRHLPGGFLISLTWSHFALQSLTVHGGLLPWTHSPSTTIITVICTHERVIRLLPPLQQKRNPNWHLVFQDTPSHTHSPIVSMVTTTLPCQGSHYPESQVPSCIAECTRVKWGSPCFHRHLHNDWKPPPAHWWRPVAPAESGGI